MNQNKPPSLLTCFLPGYFVTTETSMIKVNHEFYETITRNSERKEPASAETSNLLSVPISHHYCSFIGSISILLCGLLLLLPMEHCIQCGLASTPLCCLMRKGFLEVSQKTSSGNQACFCQGMEHFVFGSQVRSYFSFQKKETKLSFSRPPGQKYTQEV